MVYHYEHSTYNIAIIKYS